jgi:hypothetical protein
MTTFCFRYVAGETPIEVGGFVWIAMRHITQSTVPQTTDPTAAGFVTISGPIGVKLQLITWGERTDTKELFLRAFPWQSPIEVRVLSGELKAGDEIIITYGDMTGGGPGVKMQASQEPSFAFRIYVAPSPIDPILPMASDLHFPIVGGSVERLAIIASHSLDKLRPVRLLIRAEDKCGNQAHNYNNEIMVYVNVGEEITRQMITIDDGGLKIILP